MVDGVERSGYVKALVDNNVAVRLQTLRNIASGSRFGSWSSLGGTCDCPSPFPLESEKNCASRPSECEKYADICDI